MSVVVTDLWIWHKLLWCRPVADTWKHKLIFLYHSGDKWQFITGLNPIFNHWNKANHYKIFISFFKNIIWPRKSENIIRHCLMRMKRTNVCDRDIYWLRQPPKTFAFDRKPDLSLPSKLQCSLSRSPGLLLQLLWISRSTLKRVRYYTLKNKKWSTIKCRPIDLLESISEYNYIYHRVERKIDTDRMRQREREGERKKREKEERTNEQMNLLKTSPITGWSKKSGITKYGTYRKCHICRLVHNVNTAVTGFSWWKYWSTTMDKEYTENDDEEKRKNTKDLTLELRRCRFRHLKNFQCLQLC